MNEEKDLDKKFQTFKVGDILKNSYKVGAEEFLLVLCLTEPIFLKESDEFEAHWTMDCIKLKRGSLFSDDKELKMSIGSGIEWFKLA